MNDTVASPLEFDTRLADLHRKLAEINARRASLANLVHRMVGDRKQHKGHRQVWTLRDAAALVELCRLAEGADTYDLSNRKRPSEVTAAVYTADSERHQVATQINEMDEIYRQAPWTRYFPCLSSNGHIHASLACHTLHIDTPMTWRPDLSGHTVAEAVAELGEALCTHCFPAAPVAWTAKTLTDVERDRTAAERNTAKAERETARLIKQLRDSEQFKVDGGRITTVYAAKEVIRKEVEFRDYYGHGPHPFHAAYITGAEQAVRVLLAREAANPGTGATEVDIDKIVAGAVKKNIKDGARLDPQTGQVAA